MGLLSDTLIADVADAEKIAEDEDFYSGKYKTVHMKNIMAEFFDTLFFILKGKQLRMRMKTAGCAHPKRPLEIERIAQFWL